MIILFMLGLVCVAIALLKIYEGLSWSFWMYLIVGIVCMVVYLVSLIKKKLDK